MPYGDTGTGVSGGNEPRDPIGQNGCPDPVNQWYNAATGQCEPRPGGPIDTTPVTTTQQQCAASGGTWNAATGACDTTTPTLPPTPNTSQSSLERECVMAGGKWDKNTGTCDKSTYSKPPVTNTEETYTDEWACPEGYVRNGYNCDPAPQPQPEADPCMDWMSGMPCPNGMVRGADNRCCPNPSDPPPPPAPIPTPYGTDCGPGYHKSGQYCYPDRDDQYDELNNMFNPQPPMDGYDTNLPPPSPYAPGPAPNWDDIAPPDLYQPPGTGSGAPTPPGQFYASGGAPVPQGGNLYNVGTSVQSPYSGSFSAYDVGTSVMPPPPPGSAYDVGTSAQQNNAYDIYNTGQSAQQNNAFDVYNTGQSQGFTETGIGGVSAYDVNAQGMNYGEVQNFTDQAYAEAMRNLEPQQEAERQRFEQELINKGIDPYSDAGQKELAQLERSQNDQKSKAAYDAMAFGAQMQQQMFGQGATESQLAQSLLSNQWNMQQGAREFDVTAGMTAEQQAYQQAANDAAANQSAREFDVGAGMSAEQQAYNQALQDAQANQSAREFDVTTGMTAEQMQFDQMMQNYNAQQAGHEFDVTAGMQAEQDAFNNMMQNWEQQQAGHEFDVTSGLTAEEQQFNEMMQSWQAGQQGYEFNTSTNLSAQELAYNQQLASAQLNQQNEQYYAQLGLDAQTAQQQMQLDRYAMEQAGYQFNEQYTMAQNMMEFDQMMQLEGLDYRDYLTTVDQARYQDSLALGIAGIAPAPGYQTIGTGLPNAPLYDYAGQNTTYNGTL